MIVAKITEVKALELKTKTYMNGVKYNPLQDNNDNWIISLTELQYSSDLINEVELIEYVPKVQTK